MNLTKNAENLLRIIYGEYAGRVKGGADKNTAVVFESPRAIKHLTGGFSYEVINESFRELMRDSCLTGKINVDGSIGEFKLTDTALEYLSD